MDYREHERTYEGFIRLSKIGGVAVVVVLILMAIFLL
ncbi:aa3-type cytochrome c oxidase subunit IV [Pseudochelatococcus sp. G4_1912]